MLEHSWSKRFGNGFISGLVDFPLSTAIPPWKALFLAAFSRFFFSSLFPFIFPSIPILSLHTYHCHWLITNGPDWRTRVERARENSERMRITRRGERARDHRVLCDRGSIFYYFDNLPIISFAYFPAKTIEFIFLWIVLPWNFCFWHGVANLSQCILFGGGFGASGYPTSMYEQGGPLICPLRDSRSPGLKRGGMTRHFWDLA